MFTQHETSDVDGRAARAKAANDQLAKAAIRVLANGRDAPSVFIGNAKTETLMGLFEGSRWAGGAWKQSVGRIPGAWAYKGGLTLAGIPSRGTCVPLASIKGLMDGPQNDQHDGYTQTQAPPEVHSRDINIEDSY